MSNETVGTRKTVYLKDGVEIVRVVTGHAYARNGNAHRPTAHYRWEVFCNGRRVGTSLSGKGARALAQEVTA